MSLKTDTPIEIYTRDLYHYLMSKYAGVIAGQELEGKYYIKIWYPRFTELIEKELNEKNIPHN